MKSAATKPVAVSTPDACAVNSPERREEGELDPLFLESLVAEANRLLDGLNAVRCRVVVEGRGQPEIRVDTRESHLPVGGLSGEEIRKLANKVRLVQELLYGGA
ncbi:MAG: hypothetical protein HQM00_11080 [Magnetococcales bacterium]|nr:hypothetical protein [Magnetococcales bacterium]